jgi:glutamine synthetase
LSEWSSPQIKLAIKSFLDKLKDAGITPKIGVELEFYLRYKGQIPDKSIVDSFAQLLPEFNLEIERGQGQYECVIAYSNVIDAIKNYLKLKRHIIKASKVLDLEAIFKPKPFVDDYGSAMHLHYSIHNCSGENLFHLKPNLMEQVIFALLELVESDLEFIYTADSESRFKPGWMAPSHLSWGNNNRSVVVRTPIYKPENKRFEFRLPSADADIQKVVLMVLVANIFAFNNPKQFPKIFGNAYDPQYNLPRLQFSNNIPNRRFLQEKSLFEAVNKIKI